ncbi:MAG TPA: hybrid sensor histidine kinase/response regulator [Chloroflexota bacterium]
MSIRVGDNGLGISEEQRIAALERAGNHLGLAGLVRRLSDWHCTLGIRRLPQGGTEVTATIALSPYAGYVPDGRGAARIRILLVDGHEIVRRGLAQIIATAPDLELAGECAAAVELVAVTGRSLRTMTSGKKTMKLRAHVARMARSRMAT